MWLSNIYLMLNSNRQINILCCFKKDNSGKYHYNLLCVLDHVYRYIEKECGVVTLSKSEYETILSILAMIRNLVDSYTSEGAALGEATLQNNYGIYLQKNIMKLFCGMQEARRNG